MEPADPHRSPDPSAQGKILDSAGGGGRGGRGGVVNKSFR